MGAAFIEALGFAKFHGIGPVTAEKMLQLGIKTSADLKEKCRDFLVEHFGKGTGTMRSHGATTIARSNPIGRSNPTLECDRERSHG
jgi:nucleotidyltransferase/DNA polymerase involved in DNA repair